MSWPNPQSYLYLIKPRVHQRLAGGETFLGVLDEQLSDKIPCHARYLTQVTPRSGNVRERR